MGMSEREKDPAMKEGYLWDGSGEPDPEVQKLESLLRRYRHDQPRPPLDPPLKDHPRRGACPFLPFHFPFPCPPPAASFLRATTKSLFWRRNKPTGEGPLGKLCASRARRGLAGMCSAQIRK